VNDESDNHPDNLLDQATAKLRESAGTEMPPAFVVEQTLAALRQRSKPQHQRRFTMFKRQSLAAAAAIVIISGGAFVMLSQRSASLAFGAVIENVRAVQTVAFKMKGKTQLPDGKMQDVSADVIVSEPSLMRQEINGGSMVMISDLAAGKQLMLNPATKTSTLVNTTSLTGGLVNFNIIDQFRKFDPKTFTKVGEKTIGQIRATGFQSVNPAQTQTVWVDPKTELPIEMELSFSGAMMPTASYVMTDFDWAPRVDEATFSLTPPQGYQSQSVSMDLSKSGEADVLAALRKLAEFNDGTLPDSIDMNGLMQATKGLAKKLATAKQNTPEMQQKAMDEMTPIARGLGFLATQTDAHYAGKGVKLNEKDRPILWYRPAGATKYRVIDASLAVTEVEAKDLPKTDSVPVGATTAPAAK
jgi:outer membrane lipoprotein-sorting protein